MIYDVIVVGVGPGGSSAATFLARQGIIKLEFHRTPAVGLRLRATPLLTKGHGAKRACDLLAGRPFGLEF